MSIELILVGVAQLALVGLWYNSKKRTNKLVEELRVLELDRKNDITHKKIVDSCKPLYDMLKRDPKKPGEDLINLMNNIQDK